MFIFNQKVIRSFIEVCTSNFIFANRIIFKLLNGTFMKLSIRELFNAVVEEAVDQHLVLASTVELEEELLVVEEDWMEVNSIYEHKLSKLYCT